MSGVESKELMLLFLLSSINLDCIGKINLDCIGKNIFKGS